jgi:DNA-binding response OmpR family regulator
LAARSVTLSRGHWNTPLVM